MRSEAFSDFDALNGFRGHKEAPYTAPCGDIPKNSGVPEESPPNYEQFRQANSPGPFLAPVELKICDEITLGEKQNTSHAVALGPIRRPTANKILCRFKDAQGKAHLFVATLVPALSTFMILEARLSYFKDATYDEDGLNGTCEFSGYIGPGHIELEITSLESQTIAVITGALQKRMAFKNQIAGVGTWMKS